MLSALQYFTPRVDQYLDELRQLVALETPTGDHRRAAHAASFLAERFAPFGSLEVEELARWGPMIRLLRPGTGSRVLLLAHYDTVWPAGAWDELWQPSEDRVSGPGVCDMKGGLLFLLWTLRYLRHSGRAHPTIELMLTPDEEVGSTASRPRIEAAARRAEAVLVTECPAPGGELKIARKGSGEYRLVVTGRAAHQGEAPESGVNAVVEASRQVLRLLELADPERGTTIGPNLIRGGELSNVVAESCTVSVDVRAWTRAEVARLDAAFAGLEAFDRGSRLAVEGAWNRPPMEPTEASRELLERARSIGAGLGMALTSRPWGGSSDANITAAVGTPTLDGLGPPGDGSHRRDEHILIAPLPARMALLSELVASLTVPVGARGRRPPCPDHATTGTPGREEGGSE